MGADWKSSLHRTRAVKPRKVDVDTYELFIEKGLKLATTGGRFGYIVPSPLLTNQYTRNLRKFLLERHNLAKCDITDFGMDVLTERD